MTRHIQIGCIQKYKLHLSYAQHHAQYWRYRNKNIVAACLTIELKELSEFQTGIDHVANGKGNGAYSQIEATKVADFVFDVDVVAFICNKCGVKRQ